MQVIFFHIPLLLLLIALQFSAARRRPRSRGWATLCDALTIAAFLFLPLLFYFGILIGQPDRASSSARAPFVSVGSFYEVRVALLHMRNDAMLSAILIGICGLAVRFVSNPPDRILKILEILAWVAFVIVSAGLIVLLISLKLKGLNH